MWIASKLGFFSIVNKAADAVNTYGFHVRARKKSDLIALKELCGEPLQDVEIQTWPNADYRWRMIISNHEFWVLFEHLIETIDYDNFKDEAAKSGQTDKLGMYHDLWASMYRYQDKNEAIEGRK
jgi:hypothetical protein